MQQKGYKEAQILESDGRFRVAINRYTNQTDAYKQIKELKKMQILRQHGCLQLNKPRIITL